MDLWMGRNKDRKINTQTFRDTIRRDYENQPNNKTNKKSTRRE